METGMIQAAAEYAEDMLGAEGFRYVSAVVANCKMLALELEMQEHGALTIDHEALIIAAYLHDLSTVLYGFQDHQLKSAEMAVEFLRELNMPKERIKKVEQAIVTHTLAAAEHTSLEGRILYDADKLGRLSGLAVVTSLVEFGARYPNKVVTGEALAALLRHVEERFVDLYQSLNTAPAREMAKEKFGRTLAFLDGVIEHLSDATPV
jgi:hypothetical protein